MVNRIKNPVSSKRCMIILSRVLHLEEPYSTNIANSLDVQRDNIQGYIETMVDKGWLEKKKEGRKAILEINPLEIWRETGRLQLLKGLSANINSDEVLDESVDESDLIREAEESELEPGMKEFLEKYLIYMIRHSVDSAEKKDNLDIFYENNLPSEHDWGNVKYIYAINDLNEVLRDIRLSIEMVDSAIEELDVEIEPFTEIRTGVYETLTKGYLNMLKGDEIGTPPEYEIDY